MMTFDNFRSVCGSLFIAILYGAACDYFHFITQLRDFILWIVGGFK